MAYVTQTDLETAITARTVLELSDDDANGVIDTGVIEAVCESAQAEVDGYLRVHYQVPMAEPPRLVQLLALEVAIFRLFSRRVAALEVPEAIVERYKGARRQLEAIRKGELDLGEDPPPAASTAAVATTQGGERLFTDTTMEDF